jgi:hypothetical protein
MNYASPAMKMDQPTSGKPQSQGREIEPYLPLSPVSIPPTTTFILPDNGQAVNHPRNPLGAPAMFWRKGPRKNRASRRTHRLARNIDQG